MTARSSSAPLTLLAVSPRWTRAILTWPGQDRVDQGYERAQASFAELLSQVAGRELHLTGFVFSFDEPGKALDTALRILAVDHGINGFQIDVVIDHGNLSWFCSRPSGSPISRIERLTKLGGSFVSHEALDAMPERERIDSALTEEPPILLKGHSQQLRYYRIDADRLAEPASARE